MPNNTPAGQVEQDVKAGLSGSFRATGGFSVRKDLGGAPITNGRATAVVWEYACKHTGEFQGIKATGREIVIRGATIVDERPRGKVVFHRYVDWLSVMTQLGLTSTFSPALDPVRKQSK